MAHRQAYLPACVQTIPPNRPLPCRPHERGEGHPGTASCLARFRHGCPPPVPLQRCSRPRLCGGRPGRPAADWPIPGGARWLGPASSVEHDSVGGVGDTYPRGRNSRYKAVCRLSSAVGGRIACKAQSGVTWKTQQSERASSPTPASPHLGFSTANQHPALSESGSQSIHRLQRLFFGHFDVVDVAWMQLLCD